MTNDFITLVANLALTLSFIVALVFGIAQVHAAKRDRRERLTLEALRNFQTREFSDLMYTVNNYKIVTTLEEWRTLPKEDQVKFIQFTQQMESLGILVAEKFISIDLVDKTLGSFVITSWNKFKIVIFDIRIKAPDPFLSEYFQWSAEQIDQRMNQKPRTPFHEAHATAPRK